MSMSTISKSKAATKAATYRSEFMNDVVHGLSLNPKQLQCKYFYDERGSRLFDEICKLPEYYPTRTEQSIMACYAGEMAEQLGERVMLVEYGSGSSWKTRVLLDNLNDPAAYVPLDISEEHLQKTATKLREDYPSLEILPLVADFTQAFELPVSTIEPSHSAVYFPGSTIGNFEPAAAESMLQTVAGILGGEGGLLIGIDLQKDPTVIEAAYNDSQGVTDQFNLNVLHRVNRELGGNFNVDQFRHVAFYNSTMHRVEICVESLCYQTVQIGENEFAFGTGERVLTEYSHKYTIESFAELASRAEFTLRKSWTDEKDYFAVLHLVNKTQK